IVVQWVREKKCAGKTGRKKKILNGEAQAAIARLVLCEFETVDRREKSGVKPEQLRCCNWIRFPTSQSFGYGTQTCSLCAQRTGRMPVFRTAVKAGKR